MITEKMTKETFFLLYWKYKLYMSGKYDILNRPDFTKSFKSIPINEQKIFKKIWNEYENSLFTLNEYRLYILYNGLINKLDINKFSYIEFNKMSEYFSSKRIILDRSIIKSIDNDCINNNKYDELFYINLLGISKICYYILSEAISPLIYIIDKPIDINEKNENADYLRFRKICSEIKIIINRMKHKKTGETNENV